VPDRWWCYGLKQGFFLIPPPSARVFPGGFNPNTLPGMDGLWTPAGSLADCAQELCRGPFGKAFTSLVRRIWGERPTQLELEPAAQVAALRRLRTAHLTFNLAPGAAAAVAAQLGGVPLGPSCGNKYCPPRGSPPLHRCFATVDDLKAWFAEGCPT
jgi:hypothetical protein